eukprot:11662350-Heterocapsa_arctica.AAC.1
MGSWVRHGARGCVRWHGPQPGWRMEGLLSQVSLLRGIAREWTDTDTDTDTDIEGAATVITVCSVQGNSKSSNWAEDRHMTSAKHVKRCNYVETKVNYEFKALLYVVITA